MREAPGLPTALSSGPASLPPPPPNDPFIEAIAERLRAIIARTPGHALEDKAAMLGVSPDTFRAVIERRAQLIDPAVLIEIVAAIVRELGVDPCWQLIGKSDPNLHRQALLLGEDRSETGSQALRAFVRAQFHQVREAV